jgi:hypothetical protein
MIDCAMLSDRSQSRQPRAAGINRPFVDEAAVKQVLKRAAEARQDVAEVSTALRIVLRGQELD